nr:immunoglobulin light chain junction region [Macaca mulatta]
DYYCCSFRNGNTFLF